jgi:hypothetical protein
MESGPLQPGMESILERVLLLSLAAAGICMVALIALMIIGRWQHAVRQREKAKRPNL